MSNQKGYLHYHALDGLRAVLMLLGVVIHISMSYVDITPENFWPFKDTVESPVFTFLFVFIHSFRMPLFMLIAGFFTSLLVERRGWKDMYQNRFMRILVPLVFAWVLLMPLIIIGAEFATLKAGRPTITALLGGISNLQSGEYQRGLGLRHMWFLYYLMLFYFAALPLYLALRKMPETLKESALNKVGTLITSPWGPVILGLLTFPTLMPLSFKTGMIVPGESFIPDIGMFLAYGPFFYFGWLVYQRRELLFNFKVGARRRFLFGMLSLGGLLYLGLMNLENPIFLRQLTAVFLSGLTIWFFSFAFIGLFLRYANKPSPTMKYMMDSSYWVYLLHLPLTLFIPPLFYDFALSVYVKFALSLGTTMLICLLSYHFLVRATFVGKILNGRKYPLKLGKSPESSEKLAA